MLPILPNELQRDIFEMTAQEYPEMAIVLVLVAHRVRIWIEKLIYEVVDLSNYNKCAVFLRTIDARPPDFFQTNVKAICLPYWLKAAQVSRILSVCNMVDDLGFWAPIEPRCLQAGSTFPRPRKLSVSIRSMFVRGPPDLGIPFFSNITHLRVTDGWTSWITEHEFHRIPNLTHLAINFFGITDAHLPFVAPILNRILVDCKKLEVYVLYNHEYEMDRAKKSLEMHGVTDPRMVVQLYTSPMETWAAFRGRKCHASEWLDAENKAREQIKMVSGGGTAI